MGQAPLDADAQKAAAARYAAGLVEPGMVVGLGTGSTAEHFVRELGARLREGLRLTGVATSQRTERLARDLGIAAEVVDATLHDDAVAGRLREAAESVGVS